MLDMQWIRENPDRVRQAVRIKKDDVDVDLLLEKDATRRRLIGEAEQLKRERNDASQRVAVLKKEKKDAATVIAAMKQVSDKIKAYDEQIGVLEGEIQELLAKVPNIPHASVKKGADEKDNEVVALWGEKPAYAFPLKDHMQLGTMLDILDFPRASKITGAGFPMLKGAGALLDRALINFMLDAHIGKNGYREVSVPYLVNSASAFGTGQLPKTKEQMYYIQEDDFYCIPTAEVPVTNIHRDEIVDADRLPIKYCSYTACFRREAGSYGKDTKGFLRVHQFNKVELVKVVPQETSYDELEALRLDAEGIIRALGLHYRVVALCDADLSFAAAKCYDLEVWAPGEQKYLEVSSCSNFEAFQARRMNIRYRSGASGKLKFVHTLNGSGLATSRILVALMETYQTQHGTIRIPEVLAPYMHGMKEIGPT